MTVKITITCWLLIIIFFLAFWNTTTAQDIELLSVTSIYRARSMDINGNYAFIGSSNQKIWIYDLSSKSDPQPITQFYFSNKHYDLQNHGDYLYVATENDGLAVFDISDMYNPILVDDYHTDGTVNDIFINGNLAYLILDGYSMRILDISNPEQLVEQGIYDSPWPLLKVIVRGDYAYLVRGNYGMIVINISNPLNPVLVGTCPPDRYSRAIQLKGNYAYLANCTPGLNIVDISDPAGPFLVDSLFIGSDECVMDIAIFQDFVFLAASIDGVFVYDISDPTGPVFISNFDVEHEECDIIIQQGYYTYTLDIYGTGNLRIFRFTGLGNGALTGTVSNANGDPLEGTIVTALNSPFTDTTDINGEYFLEGFYSDLHDIEFVHPYYADTLITDLSLVSGDTVDLDVVLRYPPGIDVGVSSIISPVDSVEFGEEHDLVVEVTNYGFSAQNFDLYFEIYYADSNELVAADTTTVYDIPEMSVETVYFFETFTPERFKSYDIISYTSLPGDENSQNDTSFAVCHGYKSYPQIEEISSTWFPYHLYDIYIKGNFAYVDNLGGKILIFDISNRESPFIAESLDVHSGCLTGAGNYLYTKSYQPNILSVYNLINPLNPVLIWSDTSQYGGADDIVVGDGYLYVGETSVLSVYNVSDPANPVFSSYLNTPGLIYDLFIKENHIFISDYDCGAIADISDPLFPFITASFVTPSGSQIVNIDVIGEYAYVPDHQVGLLIYDVTDPYNPAFLEEYGGHPGTWFVDTKEDFIYTSDDSQFFIYDALYPDTLVMAAALPGANSGWRFSVDGDYIYLLCGQVLKILRFPLGGSGTCDYATGDVNGSGFYNGLDITYAVAFLKGGPPPPYECECTPGNTWYVSGDVNGSCSFNGLDVTYGITYFKGGPAPFPCADCPPAE